MRSITINPILNGWVVNVGCQSLAYTDKGKLLGDLASYFEDPESTEKRIIETEGVNRRLLKPQDPDCRRNVACDQERPMGVANALGRP